MLAHALAAPIGTGGYRCEACGILAMDPSGGLARFYPTRNIGACPTLRDNYDQTAPHEHSDACASPTRYVVDPQDQVRVTNELRRLDWEIGGIFHSHTHTQAYPSSTDVSLAANWPEAYYLIASLMADEPVLRAFRIVNGQVTEEDISIKG